MPCLCKVVILGARNPLSVDCSSRIEEAFGVMEVSLIPTPWPNDLAPPGIPDIRIINNTIAEGAENALFPVCHLLFLEIPEDVFRVVFILYLLCCLNVLNV